MKSFLKTSAFIALCASLIYYFNQIAIFLFPSHADRTGELIKLILSVIGGVCIIYGLYISNRRAKATEKSVLIQTKQINLSLKSQIDERFKNAIEHLGSNKEPIILGGIAELHQIAKEDSNKYSEVVFNILCSYIRTETNRYKKKADDITTPTAVATIVNYLFKNVEFTPYKLYCANLSASNLSGQNIRDCYFKNANLSQCYLHSISNSILDGADFTGSEIFGSSIKHNSWRGAKLFHAKIISVSFNNIDFSPLVQQKDELFAPYCFNCKFENVAFDNITIFGAFFIGCIFVNCSFKKSTLGDSFFYCCSFENTSFLEPKIISRVDFSASVFWNSFIGASTMDIILKSCSIEKTLNIFILIEEQVEKQRKIKSTAKSLSLPTTLPSNYIFGQLSEAECNSILEKYKDLYKARKNTLTSNDKSEE